MRKEKWSPYAKYLVIADNSNARFGANYLSYQSYLDLKDLMYKIAKSQKTKITYKGKEYAKPNAELAQKNLERMDEAKFHYTMLEIANRFNIRMR